MTRFEGGFSGVLSALGPRLLGVFLVLFLWACAEVPITQRKALHLVPQSQLLTLSLDQYTKVLKEARLSEDREKTAMVKRVGGRIARSAEAFLEETGQGGHAGDYSWEFNLIEDDKTVNAWCMPGGKVAVYTGILPVTKDETGLAVV
ncbi:MAG: hypothetical protein JW821_14595, partial [Deltaproteobacteria bacterium]|nr:hypothetical protein [Deltaproteobacteria bacterium]